MPRFDGIPVDEPQPASGGRFGGVPIDEAPAGDEFTTLRAEAATRAPQSAPAGGRFGGVPVDEPVDNRSALDTASDFAKDTGRLALAGSLGAVQDVAGDAAKVGSRLTPLGPLGPVVAAGARKVADVVLDAAGAPTTGAQAEMVQRGKKAALDSMSPEMKAASEKQWWDSDKGELGPAWTDPRSYYAGLVQSLPETVLSMGPTMGLARAAFRNAVGRVGQEEASKLAARTATVAGGATEGGLQAAQSERDVADEIRQMTPEKLKDSDALRALMDGGLSFEQARERLASDAGTRAFALAGVATALFAGQGDRYLAKLMTEGTKSGVLKRVAKGAVSEGVLEEFPQSYLSKVAENEAMRSADPSRPLTEGAMNEGLGGLAIGAVQGGGQAAAFGRPMREAAAASPSPGGAPVPASDVLGAASEPVANELAVLRDAGVPVQEYLGGGDLLGRPFDNESITVLDRVEQLARTNPAAAAEAMRAIEQYEPPKEKSNGEKNSSAPDAAPVQAREEAGPASGTSKPDAQATAATGAQPDAGTDSGAGGPDASTRVKETGNETQGNRSGAGGQQSDGSAGERSRGQEGRSGEEGQAGRGGSPREGEDRGTGADAKGEGDSAAQVLQGREGVAVSEGQDAGANRPGLDRATSRTSTPVGDQHDESAQAARSAADVGRSAPKRGEEASRLEAQPPGEGAQTGNRSPAGEGQAPEARGDASRAPAEGGKQAPAADGAGRPSVDAAAHEAATSPKNDLRLPTEPQIEAGNYKKGHARIGGLDLSIENPAGSKRRPAWPTLKSHYGYIKGTEGADHEHIDAFVRPGTPNDWNGPVFVVDQVKKDGHFDEAKVMLGFPDLEAARAGYAENFTRDFRIGPITQMDLPRFKAWAASPFTKRPVKSLSLSEWKQVTSDLPPANEGPKQEVRKGEQRQLSERRGNGESRKRVSDMTPEELAAALLTDELTGLGNRRAYEEAPKRAVQASLDADGLKWINDVLGHKHGDELLKVMGQALREEGIEAYHVSGDEFYAQFDSGSDAHKALARVRARLAGMTIVATAPDGSSVEKTGVTFSYGTGKDLTAAEAGLQRDKLAREASGERSARGAEPAGVARRPAVQAGEALVQAASPAAVTPPKSRAGEPGTVGMRADEARRAIATIIAKSKVPISVVQTVKETGLDLEPDARGAYDNGRIWLVADNVSTPLDAERTVARHEFVHAGFDLLYGGNNKAREIALKDLQSKNRKLREIASGWRVRYGEEFVQKLMADDAKLTPAAAEREMFLRSMEESVAYHAEQAPLLNGWRTFLVAIQRGLRHLGFARLAALLESGTQAETSSAIAQLLRAVEETPANGEASLGAAQPAMSRGQPLQSTSFDPNGAPEGRRLSASGPLDALLARAGGQWVADHITKPAYSRVLDLGKYVPEKIKAGVVSDYALPSEYIDKRTEMRINQREGVKEAQRQIEMLSGLNRAQSRIAYQWMTQREAEGDVLLGQIPEKEQAVLRDLKVFITSLGREAVALGQLAPESFARNEMAYLHRTYQKFELEDTQQEKVARARAIKVMGEQYKGRGMVDQVDASSLDGPTAKGAKYVRLEQRTVATENEVAGGAHPDTQRLRRVVYVSADKAIPAKYASWSRDSGTWELRYPAEGKGETVGLWRDFTAEERQRMGELDEVRYAVAKTLMMMTRDIETGRLMRWVGEQHGKASGEGLNVVPTPTGNALASFKKSEWVEVPQTKIPGTDVHAFGDLAGKYIPAAMWNDIRQISNTKFSPFGETYGALLRAWKTSKTALSPGVHVNNVMSNVILADMANVGAWDMAKALKVFVDSKGGDAEALALIERYGKSGAEMGAYAITELQKETIQPLLDELRREVSDRDQTASLVYAASAFHNLFHKSEWGELAEKVHGTKGAQLGKKAVQAMIKAYQNEDAMFRFTTFLKAVNEGKSDLEAGKIAREAFLDYNINAPWIQNARSTLTPFIAFTYRAVPMLLRAAAETPWKLAKYFAVAGGLNMLAYAMLGMSGSDEDKERQMLPDEKSGKIWGIFPRLIRLPWNLDEHGSRTFGTGASPVFLDVRRWVPVGDIIDFGQHDPAIPIPAPLFPGGPLVILSEIILNKKAFDAKAITLETDTPLEKGEKFLKYLVQSVEPNLLGLPWAYSTDSVLNAGKGGTDAFGRELNLSMALENAVGIKEGAYPADVLAANVDSKLKHDEMTLDMEFAQVKRKALRHSISDEDFDQEVARYSAKRDKLHAQALKKLEGTP